MPHNGDRSFQQTTTDEVGPDGTTPIPNPDMFDSAIDDQTRQRIESSKIEQRRLIGANHLKICRIRDAPSKNRWITANAPKWQRTTGVAVRILTAHEAETRCRQRIMPRTTIPRIAPKPFPGEAATVSASEPSIGARIPPVGWSGQDSLSAHSRSAVDHADVRREKLCLEGSEWKIVLATRAPLERHIAHPRIISVTGSSARHASALNSLPERR
jgi:hypothetical protein